MSAIISSESNSSRNLAWKIGQMLVIGFPGGREGLAILRRTVAVTKAGNIILFSRNTPDAESARATVAEARSIIESVTQTPPLVAIDQEGGAVTRLRRGVTSIPGAMAQAAACLGGRIGMEDIEELGRICGADLAAQGINWNLAPVADVNVNPNNPIIGVRSYGERPESVAEFASAFACGLGQAGIMATAKHFPGHGDTVVDSHLDLPLVGHNLERLRKVELLPFIRLIAERIPAVMTSHVRFPAVEPEALPATLSSRVLEGLLRRELGFEGIICTDCLEMKAIADHFSNPYVRAVKAGADILFVSHTAECQIEAFDSIRRAVETGEIPESRIDESVARIMACKAVYAAGGGAPLGGNNSGIDDADGLTRRISFASITTLFGNPEAGRAASPTAGRILIDVAPSNLTGAEDDQEPASIASKLDELRSGWTTCSLAIDPSEADISEALETAGLALGPGGTLALSLYSPFGHRGQVELMRQCARLMAERGGSLVLLVMRSPYDAPRLAKICSEASGQEPTFLAAYEYTRLSAASMATFLAGQSPASGRCPVSLKFVAAWPHA